MVPAESVIDLVKYLLYKDSIKGGIHPASHSGRCSPLRGISGLYSYKVIKKTINISNIKGCFASLLVLGLKKE